MSRWDVEHVVGLDCVLPADIEVEWRCPTCGAIWQPAHAMHEDWRKRSRRVPAHLPGGAAVR